MLPHNSNLLWDSILIALPRQSLERFYSQFYDYSQKQRPFSLSTGSIFKFEQTADDLSAFQAIAVIALLANCLYKMDLVESQEAILPESYFQFVDLNVGAERFVGYYNCYCYY